MESKEHVLGIDQLPTVSLDSIHSMFDEKRKRSLIPHPWADESDYLRANGTNGLDVKRRNEDMFYVLHSGLKGENVVVPTHNLRAFEIVMLDGIPDRYFLSALLWQFHGQPCETRSQSSGGDSYDRF